MSKVNAAVSTNGVFMKRGGDSWPLGRTGNSSALSACGGCWVV
jgi:hypothetical protein